MSKTNPLTFVLAAAFGSGSWLGVNSIWMEMSLMSQKLPEGWALASCATLVLQIGCVLVVLYTCLVKCTSFRPPVVPFIQVCLIVCAMVYLPLAFLWDTTATVFGASHSWVFVLCAFVLGTINVLSNVLFVPYMCAFDTQYLVAYFIGTGVSQLLPSVVAIIQGVFGVRWNPYA
ncbi:Protein Y47D7A.16 [Aphelenchoides avenae]|nr:Protein Y47D7A.16 [Aphelenchus avenae]